MFWNLMRVFCVYHITRLFVADDTVSGKHYLILALMLTIRCCAGFLTPVTINRLLAFVETKGEGALVKPWVWVILMFAGPVVGSIAMQYYIFITVGLFLGSI
jgi:hypothetical protein